MALKQFHSEHGDYPIASVSQTEEQRGKILFMSLSGWLDASGNEIEKDLRGKSFLPSDSYALGQVDGDDIETVTLTGDQLLGDIGKDEEIFLIDPWSTAYVYEYPRSDGHTGYLLYSKALTGSRLILQLNLRVLLKNSRLMKIIFPHMNQGSGKGFPELVL